MNHIVIDARKYTSSTGRVLRELLPRLQRLDQENKYSVLMKPDEISLLKITNPNFTIVEADFADYSFGEQIGLWFLLRRLKADLTFFFMPQQPLFFTGRKITMVHDLTLIDFKFAKQLPWYKAWYRNRLKPLVFKGVIGRFVSSSEVVISPSKYVSDQINDRFKTKKAIAIHLAGSQVDGQPEEVAALPKEYLFFVGNLFPHKHLKLVIDALPELQVHRPELGLVLAGKTNDLTRDVQNYAKKSGAKEVVFTDYVSEPQLKYLYQNAAAYVFPSLSEGFGLPGLEAMAEKCPVLSSSATCLPEIYGDGAIYFDPASKEDFINQTLGLLSDVELKRQLVIEGTHQAKKYSWERTAEEFLQQFNSVLS